ncbi:cupin-like domain-containing protein [Rubinisphaera sp.]|uniref:cupin-like domain-containing protein n=1 Tax=Rubinisphaera sp. TaxID=2024857 RepID=UPI000C1025F4|nr:cupin-like domain-containing protein [Rubinisphaera sp.]MBV12300.1 transcription factor [Rubinisphaera sp.]HCS52047.1 transcription factor [Planctomycetaceae bacterium]|tara:strand:+ start:3783 stop:4685 length:903 start_codon:yes stop_codon:yes gene_type:complete
MIDAVQTRPVTEVKTNSKPGEWLSWNQEEFEHCFSKRPFLISHDLCNHPFFDVERLLELAQKLPADQIEYNAGQLPVSISHAETPMNGLSADETIRRIAECKSWMVMKYIEQDPEYRQLLEECLAQVAPLTEKIAPGMMKPHAFVFMTSPGSVTPYHIDPEHNFLLQIRGEKIVRLYDGNDPTLLSPRELEDFYCDRGRNLVISEENKERCWTYRLKPGQALHFPVTFPHWVENADDVSISFSITFRTPDLDRRRALYRMNSGFRKLGCNPAAPGTNRLCDNACYQAFRVWRKASSFLGR